MTQTGLALDSELRDELPPHAEALNVLASRCDKMCLTAGVLLGDAVPGLYDLSSRFASLSAMLIDEGGAKPAQSLESAARDIMTIGSALAEEREAVAVVIDLNSVLTRRIGDLADNVRFLSSVVFNVKIEIAAINEGELRLDGFADNLKQLAAKSDTTVKAFQTTHQTLVKQLQRTANAQSAFVTSHGTKFVTASQEISASLSAVSNRRKGIAGIAGEIGALTQQIGTQIAQCVVALQIGDSTRQRLEHAGDALSTAAEIAAGRNPSGISEDMLIDEAPARGELIAVRICELQVIQTEEATTEFTKEVGTIAYLVDQITDAAIALTEKSRALVSSPGDMSRSFLADLEAKLAFAGDLVEECGQSRRLVDNTAEQVIASVRRLQSLAADVAGMATDMMIIGTNAVVTSYRLGTKGIPLSVIAQHLRNHAVRVTDAVKLVSPALDKVLDAAKQFTSAREGQGADAMEGLARCIAEALGTFQAGDSAVVEVRDRLEAQVSTVGGVLRHASDALREIDDVEPKLQGIARLVGGLVAARPWIGDHDKALSPAVDRILRQRYTMGSERVIHDRLLGPASATVAPPPTPPASDASLWL